MLWMNWNRRWIRPVSVAEDPPWLQIAWFCVWECRKNCFSGTCPLEILTQWVEKKLKYKMPWLLLALSALVNVKWYMKLWQALYIETTRSIVWLAKKSKTETVAAAVWDRAPGARSLGMVEAKVLRASLDWHFLMPVETGSLLRL